MFRHRSGELAMAALPMKFMYDTPIAAHINKSIEAFLFRGISGFGYFYLPPVGKKLFERLNLHLMAQIITKRQFESMFCYSLLMDYIVPSFGHEVLTGQELTALKYLNEETMSTFIPYFVSMISSPKAFAGPLRDI
jgi:hypothetical protein